MLVQQIKKLKETTDIDIANALLNDGWTLVSIYRTSNNNPIFILGIGRA